MRRFATHSTRVAPELSTQLRIVFNLISVGIFEGSGIEGGEHLELYHRGGIDYLHEQEMKSRHTTLWLYHVLVYRIRLLSSFLRTGAGDRKWTSRQAHEPQLLIAASPIKAKLGENWVNDELGEGLLWRCFGKADSFAFPTLLVLLFLLWFWFLHDSMTHNGLFSAIFSLFTWAWLLVNL